MTQEQINAFQEWWSRSPVECEHGIICRDAFVSGWEAAQATAVLVEVPDATGIRTKETEFEKWWAHSGALHFCSASTASWIWNAAYTSAKLGQFERAKAEAESEIRAKLLALAVEVFKEGDTQRAQIIRDLADIRHNIWPDPL